MHEYGSLFLAQAINPATNSANTGATGGNATPPPAPANTVNQGVSGTPANPGTPITTQPSTQGAAGGGSGQAPGNPMQLLLIGLLMFGALYFIMFRGQRKEEKRRRNMLSEMKKGDTVMTIGGLVARIVSVDGDDVVLKIDESANVKATYKKSAIQQVLESAGDKK